MYIYIIVHGKQFVEECNKIRCGCEANEALKSILMVLEWDMSLLGLLIDVLHKTLSLKLKRTCLKRVAQGMLEGTDYRAFDVV